MSEDEITFDLSKLKGAKDKVLPFLKKYSILLLLLIPILISAQIRLIPEGLPITDDWARNAVETHYKNGIRQQALQQYPNLPEANLNNIVNEQYSKFTKENKQLIEEQTKQTSLQFKSYYQSDDGYTYMPDIDPYHWLRHARNYLEKGHIGDEIRNGSNVDNHMVAPNGVVLGDEPHVVIMAYLHKILSVFNSKITLMQSATYHPIIFSALAVIPVFFIGKLIAGNVGGLFAAIMLAINGAFLGRTTWGHADTDTYNILFAVYFAWFFLEAISSKDIKKTSIYASLAGLFIGVFSALWPGWWYVFDFALATIVAYLAYVAAIEHKFSFKALKESNKIKHIAIGSALVILTSGLFVSIFASPMQFLMAPLEPIGFSNLKEASQASLWPNVYTTVAELNEASIPDIINAIGGNAFFYLSLIGIILMFFTKTDEERKHIPHAILITIWYIGIFYASTKGIRFTMMLVPPLAIAFGAATGIIYKKATEYMKKINIPAKVGGTVLIIIYLLMIVPYMQGAAAATKNDVPIMNDAWWNSLTKIKQESQPDAIINSWWDFGHHFKFVADRAVTFDGASQNTPMAHWIGKALLTSNEKETIGILRMLDCGSNDAFEALNSEINDTPKSAGLLYDIIILEKEQARSHLISKGVSRQVVDKTIEKTHCMPPENYFITSGDMVGKSAVWAHFGIWDFNKADIWINGKDLPQDKAVEKIQQRLTVSKEEAQKIYREISGFSEQQANQWIASWPGYAGQQGCSKENSNIVCGAYQINLETKEVKVSTNSGITNVNSIVYVENNNIVEKKFKDGFGRSILLKEIDGLYSIIESSPEVAASTFTKLFFYDGVGMKQFTKFSDETHITGDRVIVWKVKW